jgi:hypothetical protein
VPGQGRPADRHADGALGTTPAGGAVDTNSGRRLARSHRGQLVVEIHLPLNGAGGIQPGDPGYEFGWIDDIEEFLDDESSDGSFDIYDEGQEIGAAYVFFVAGAPEEILLGVAADVAALPGVPSGALAVVTDDKSEEIGTGRRVALS